jgi:hypothetical protein
MSEKLWMMAKLAASLLLVLHSNQQQPANNREDDIEHHALERLRLIWKGGDVIHQ